MRARDTEQAILSELAEAEFIRAVNNDAERYRATGDARFVWKVIARYAQADKPLPMDYVRKLAEWGGKLQQISKPADIATALELSGHDKEHVGPARSAAFSKRWRLASEVHRVQRLHAGTLIDAIRIVARNSGKTLAVVKKAYHDVFNATEKRTHRRRRADDLASIMSNWR